MAPRPWVTCVGATAAHRACCALSFWRGCPSGLRRLRPTAACGPAGKWRPGWRANSGSLRSCLNAAGRRSRRSTGRCRSRARAILPRPRPRSARHLKKAGHGRCRGSGKAPGHAGRGLGHGRAPHWPEADHPAGVGAQRSAADRPRPPPLQVALRHRLRPAQLGRDLLVRVERRVQAVLRRAPGVVAREAGAGRARMIVLGLASAGWHTAPNLVVPDGIRLAYLPPDSPELQPAEHLWPVLDEPLANQYFETLADLERAVAERCLVLDGDQLSLGTNFHWWPKPTKRANQPDFVIIPPGLTLVPAA